MKFGKKVLIKNVNSEIYPYIFNVIKKNFMKFSDGSKKVEFNSKKIILHKDFYLIFFSR